MTAHENGSNTPMFEQANWTVRGDVYNVAGDLILPMEGGASDFTKALEGLKNDLHNLDGLNLSCQQAIEANLVSVVEETGSDRPEKDIIVGQLNSIQTTLEASSKTVKGALELGKVVAKFANWAGAFFS